MSIAMAILQVMRDAFRRRDLLRAFAYYFDAARRCAATPLINRDDMCLPPRD